MIKSLYSGVAGLKTHQTKMDVIGNNIANVNTNGFKGSRTVFKDVFYQSTTASADATDSKGGVNGTQVGYGSMVGSIDVLHSRGGWGPTGQISDLYIEGDGYLITQDGVGTERLTRVGSTKFDGSGNLVDGNGNYVCGYPIARDANGNILYKENIPKGGQITIGNLEIDFGAVNGSVMNDWKMTITQGKPVNVPPAADDATATPQVIIKGSEISIIVRTPRAASVGPPVVTAITANTIQEVTDALDAALAAGQALVPPTVPATTKFDLAAITYTATGGGALGDAIFQDSTGKTVVNGLDEKTSIPLIDTTGKPRRIKMPGTISDTNNDGVPDTEAKDVMKLTGVTFLEDGTIVGINPADETVIPIGQILLANVPNPNGLEMVGGSYFVAKNNTGVITYMKPGDPSVGTVKSGGLEMSNVDLSTEFADMITTQRGFQANSRIITAGDEMLQELANMKR